MFWNNDDDERKRQEEDQRKREEALQLMKEQQAQREKEAADKKRAELKRQKRAEQRKETDAEMEKLMAKYQKGGKGPTDKKQQQSQGCSRSLSAIFGGDAGGWSNPLGQSQPIAGPLQGSPGSQTSEQNQDAGNGADALGKVEAAFPPLNRPI